MILKTHNIIKHDRAQGQVARYIGFVAKLQTMSTDCDTDSIPSLPDDASDVSMALPGGNNHEHEESDADISLPSDVESVGRSDRPSEADDGCLLDWPDVGEEDQGDTEPASSSSSQLTHLPSISIGRDAVAEFYSRPRIVKSANEKGFSGTISADLATGFDFALPACRDWSFELLEKREIKLLFLSPPCTVFSALMPMWNFKRMPAEAVRQRWADAMLMLTHSMQCASKQVHNQRCFAFEHPASASSWKQQCVKSVMALPGVECVVFDQCMVGLRSKVHGTPMRKRTRIMTNCPKVILKETKKHIMHYTKHIYDANITFCI